MRILNTCLNNLMKENVEIGIKLKEAGDVYFKLKEDYAESRRIIVNKLVEYKKEHDEKYEEYMDSYSERCKV